jgi:hypothetical protein
MSSAEVRYLVLPVRPPDTDGLDEDELAELAPETRRSGSRACEAAHGPGRMPRVVDAPARQRCAGVRRALAGRALPLAVVTVERTGRTWDDFRVHLLASVADRPDRPYWESWVEPLDRFWSEAGLG